MRKHSLRGAFEIFAFFLILTAFAGCSAKRIEQQASCALPTAEASAQTSYFSADARTAGSHYATNLAAYIPPPQRMEFCGESVALENQEAWESFDREFTIVVYNNAQMYLWLKRMHRDFPWIEKRLQMLSLPDDLKYFVVEVTDLLPRVWLAKTGARRSTGLHSPPSGYSQSDYQRAVEVLLLKLQALHSQFSSWTLAVAAYYCGDKKLQEAIKDQKTSNPYLLHLPAGTETNIYRIIAIKAALTNPELYGYVLPAHACYR